MNQKTINQIVKSSVKEVLCHPKFRQAIHDSFVQSCVYGNSLIDFEKVEQEILNELYKKKFNGILND